MRRGVGVGVSVTVVEAMNSWPKRGARMNLGALGPSVAAEDSAEGGRKSCAGEKPSCMAAQLRRGKHRVRSRTK
jgi:hypothetical protein